MAYPPQLSVQTDHALLTGVTADQHHLDILSGTFAARPGAGTANRYYWSTDTHVLYRDTGAAWEIVSRPAMQVFMFGSNNSVPADNTSYFMPLEGIYDFSDAGFVGGDVNGAVRIPVAGTFKNLRVWATLAQGAGQTILVGLRVNGAGSALTCTLSVGETSKTDLVHTVAVAIGDSLCWLIQSSLTVVATRIWVSGEFYPS